jgi:anti-sigma factor RsiW
MTDETDARTCREVVDLFMDYYGGDLSQDEHHIFESHLAECPDCLVHLRSYAATIRLARFACQDDLAAGVPDELVAAILTALKPPA